MSLLEVKGLSAAYGDREVLKEISLTLEKGEVFCLTGESGSGKTTLLRAVLSMSRVAITKGSLSYAGTGIGYIPQNPEGSFNPIRRFGVQLRETMRGNGADYDEAAVIESFSVMGLKNGREILRSRPYEVSGGMNQRIAIAAAMLTYPDMLVCDEVTGALDVTSVALVIEELLRLKTSRGIAILMVTHDLGIAERIADRIGILKDGRLVETGTAEEIFYAPKNGYTKALLRDIPRIKV